MRIAFDVDGVLNDVEQFLYDYGSKYICENNLDEYFKYDEDNFINMFNVSKDINNKIWGKYIIDYCTNYPPREFASEVIDKIKNDGNEIYIITARGASLTKEHKMNLEQFRGLLLDWLLKNNIHYDKIIFTGNDKVEACLKEKIDIMVEDKTSNILAISKYIPVICMNANHNKKCNNDNITRVYGFYDLYLKIRKMYK